MTSLWHPDPQQGHQIFQHTGEQSSRKGAQALASSHAERLPSPVCKCYSKSRGRSGWYRDGRRTDEGESGGSMQKKAFSLVTYLQQRVGAGVAGRRTVLPAARALAGTVLVHYRLTPLSSFSSLHSDLCNYRHVEVIVSNSYGVNCSLFRVKIQAGGTGAERWPRELGYRRPCFGRSTVMGDDWHRCELE